MNDQNAQKMTAVDVGRVMAYKAFANVAGHDAAWEALSTGQIASFNPRHDTMIPRPYIVFFNYGLKPNAQDADQATAWTIEVETENGQPRELYRVDSLADAVGLMVRNFSSERIEQAVAEQKNKSTHDQAAEAAIMPGSLSL